MSDKQTTGVPFSSQDGDEQKLWNTLSEIEDESPSPRLRQNFYRELARAGRPPWQERMRGWLGFSNNVGWLTAMASVVLGLFAGQWMQGSDSTDRPALAALEQQVAILNRSLILDRMENASASKRLNGIIDAVSVVEGDAIVARALLTRATEDSVHSVRSAAIDALGPQLATATVGDELMSLLAAAESPLVQLALVDLVLRNGTAAQLEQLLRLVDSGLLHPDIVQHIKSSVRRDVA